MEKIIIMLGGKSEEREISLISGKEIAKELSKDYDVVVIDPNDYSSYIEMIAIILEEDPYIVFNGLHGAEGEDGRIQALLSLHKIPFTGSGYRASAIAMDKILSSSLASSVGIPVPKQLIIDAKMKDYSLVTEQIKYPIVIKPNDSGSSYGISILQNDNNLDSAIQDAFLYSNKVICEEFIPGRELTVSILGDKILPVLEMKPKQGWYDYENKYTAGNTIYEVPADISEKEEKIIKKYAIKIFDYFGCEVYGRVDFRYDGDNFYFLELNTLPGMTALSLTPKAAKQAGYSFGKLLKQIVELSISNR